MEVSGTVWGRGVMAGVAAKAGSTGLQLEVDVGGVVVHEHRLHGVALPWVARPGIALHFAERVHFGMLRRVQPQGDGATQRQRRGGVDGDVVAAAARGGVVAAS